MPVFVTDMITVWQLTYVFSKVLHGVMLKPASRGRGGGWQLPSDSDTHRCRLAWVCSSSACRLPPWCRWGSGLPPACSRCRSGRWRWNPAWARRPPASHCAPGPARSTTPWGSLRGRRKRQRSRKISGRQERALLFNRNSFSLTSHYNATRFSLPSSKVLWQSCFFSRLRHSFIQFFRVNSSH